VSEGQVQLQNGDKVRVFLTLDAWTKTQTESAGGWVEQMGKVGQNINII
jgi:hypothetical protein